MKIGNTTIEFIETKPSKENLKRLYDFCNRNFQNEDVFYTSNEIKKLKKDKTNFFIKI